MFSTEYCGMSVSGGHLQNGAPRLCSRNSLKAVAAGGQWAYAVPGPWVSRGCQQESNPQAGRTGSLPRAGSLVVRGGRARASVSGRCSYCSSRYYAPDRGGLERKEVRIDLFWRSGLEESKVAQVRRGGKRLATRLRKEWCVLFFATSGQEGGRWSTNHMASCRDR